MSSLVVKYALGLDVSRSHLHACLVQIDQQQHVKIRGTRKFANTPKGHEELVQWTDKRYRDKDLPLQVVLEATGVYHEAVSHLFHQEGYKVCIVLPNKAKRYMQALGLRSKTDRVDAKGLARLGAEQHLQAWEPVSEQLYQLRAMLRHREALLQTRCSLQNQLHAQNHSRIPNPTVVKQLGELIQTLDDQVKQIEGSIKQTAAQDAAFHEKVGRIADSIKGLGWLSVLTIVVETNGFKLFRNQRQLTAYAGYDVVERQSGKSVGKTRISKQGNSHLRRALHMPALNVVRYQAGAFPAFYQRVFQRSFIKMKAYVAVQRKLLCLIYTLWKKDSVFDPEYHISRQEANKQVAPI